MKIVNIENFKVDAGWRTNSFLKVTTDEGLVGWSEYLEGWVIVGVTELIHRFKNVVIGMDPCEVGRITSTLYAATRVASGAVYRQAMAAIENACLDIKGKYLGLPVYALFGGPFRKQVPIYWSHCGSLCVTKSDYFENILKRPPIRNLDDVKRLGQEAKERGFKAIKTNPVFFDGPKPQMFYGSDKPLQDRLDRNIDQRFIKGIIAQLEAFREGIGPQTDLAIDIHFAQRTEGCLKLAKTLEPLDLMWLELEILDPEALAFIRCNTSTPIASLESRHGKLNYKPYLEKQAADVAIVDILWNGMWESINIATLAAAYDTDIAAHNWTGALGDLINAHFCAAIPNFRIMECEIDDIPWKGIFLSNPPVIKDGSIHLSDRPGWGTEIDEEAIKANPPKDFY